MVAVFVASIRVLLPEKMGCHQAEEFARCDDLGLLPEPWKVPHVPESPGSGDGSIGAFDLGVSRMATLLGSNPMLLGTDMPQIITTLLLSELLSGSSVKTPRSRVASVPFRCIASPRR